LVVRLVGFMSHTEVNHSKHHKNERLQGKNQNVENRPGKLQQSAETCQQNTGSVHQTDKYKNHFGRIQVSKKSQAKRNRLGQQSNRFKEEVNWYKNGLNNLIARAEWMESQLCY